MNTPVKQPARQAFHKHKPMSGYLAGAVGTAALLSASQADAAIVAVDFGFGTQLSATANFYGFSPVTQSGGGGSFGTLNAYTGNNNLGLGSGSSPIYALDPGQVPMNQGQQPIFFSPGTVFGTGANVVGTAILTRGYFAKGNPYSNNFTTDQLNKIIGFQTTSGNWGWANVSYTAANKTLTFNSAYVESVAGNPITIGAVPEPSRALLALAGLGGVALRRRRKQAA